MDTVDGIWACAFPTSWSTWSLPGCAVLAGPAFVANALAFVIFGSIAGAVEAVECSWSVTSIFAFMGAWAGVFGAVFFSPVHLTDTFSEVVAMGVVYALETIVDTWAVARYAGDPAAALIKRTTICLAVPFFFAFTSALGVTEGVLFALVAFLWLRAVAEMACGVAWGMEL